MSMFWVVAVAANVVGVSGLLYLHARLEAARRRAVVVRSGVFVGR